MIRHDKEFYVVRGQRLLPPAEDGRDYVAIRVRFDGIDPTPTEGMIVMENETFFVPNGAEQLVRFVRDANSTYETIVKGPLPTGWQR